MIRRTSFYLDKRNAKFMGVCSGMADYFGINVVWVRVGIVLATIFGAAAFTIPVYFIIGFVADKKPRELYDASPEEEYFWRNVRTAPSTTIRSVRGQFRDADRRLRDIERYVTSSDRNLSAEIEKLR